ncbi:9061_t:CDS:2, partial [Cetraspora pellucida]
GLKYQSQHVLLVLDNCSSHKLDGLTLQFTDINPTTGCWNHNELQETLPSSSYLHVEKSERADGLKMDVLQAIRFIIQGWDEVTAETIRNCWCYTNILSIDTNAKLYSITDNVYQTMDLALDDLTNALEDLCIHFDDPMPVEEFLSIPAEDVVYEIPVNDQVIEELIKTFKPVDLA